MCPTKRAGAWVRRWRRLTGERINYAPYQEVAGRYPQVRAAEFAAALKLVMPDGRVFSGAEAVFRSLDYAGKRRWLLWSYERVPGFRSVSEAAYRFIASHRPFFSALTQRKQ